MTRLFLAVMTIAAVAAPLVSPITVSAGGREGFLTEEWTGRQFAGVPSPGNSDYLTGVTGAGSDVWAVGSGQGQGPLILHWGGERWAAVTQPEDPVYVNLTSISGTPKNLWAAGYRVEASGYTTIVEHWDGSAWAAVPAASTPGVLFGIDVVGAADVWAVGTSSAGDQLVVEHFDGHGWVTTVLPGCCLLQAVSSTGPKDVWAVGGNYNASQPVIEHFDGSVWRAVPSPTIGIPNYGPALYGVSALTVNDVWAVGGYQYDIPHEGNGPVYHTLAEHWDGATWAVVPTPNPTPSYRTTGIGSILFGIAATSATDVWGVGGTFVTNQGQGPSLALHWSGKAWTIVPSQSPAGSMGGSALYAVTASSDSMWAVGRMLAPWEIG